MTDTYSRDACRAPAEPRWGQLRFAVLICYKCLYPLGQFAGSPVIAALFDRFGRNPVLMMIVAEEPQVFTDDDRCGPIDSV
jgi:hypothetical protein